MFKKLLTRLFASQPNSGAPESEIEPEFLDASLEASPNSLTDSLTDSLKDSFSDKLSQDFIECYLSPLLAMTACFVAALLLLPFLLSRVPEESLIRVVGHMDTLTLEPGNTDYLNAFTFTLKEFPRQIFRVNGMRLVDQGLLSHWESFSGNFNLWVEESEFKEVSSSTGEYGPIRVYGIDTSENVYLELSQNASDAQKARLFIGCLAWVLVVAGLGTFFWLKKKFRQLEVQSEPRESLPYDSLVLWVARHPRIAGTAMASSLGVLGFFLGALLEQRGLTRTKLLVYYWSYEGSLTIAVLIFLVGYRIQKSRDPLTSPLLRELQAILERHDQRVRELSIRLATVAPKHLKAVQLLLKSGAQVNVQDQKGRSPLLIAADAGELEAVSLLLKKGANPNLPDELGNTPLMWAGSKGYLGIVMRLLASGARVDHENKQGETVLVWAERNQLKNKAVLDCLIKAAAKQKKRDRFKIKRV